MPIFAGLMREHQAEEMIEKIMERFDFARVRSVMEFLDWRWGGLDLGGEPIPGYVPTIEQLKDQARSLLQEVCLTVGGGTRSCGGFEASADPLGVQLQFHVDWRREDRYVFADLPRDVG